MTLKGVLLDVDGTLLLSNDAHAGAWVDAYAEFGYQVPFDRTQGLIGMGGDRLMDALTLGLSPDEGTGKQISDRRGEIFKQQYAPLLRPAPGARALVQHLRQSGLRTVVASSSKRDELEMLLEAANVADLIDQTVTSSDVEQSKPAPDIIHVALEKGGLRPNEVLLLGDTPYDVDAAGKADVEVIAVRCGGHSDEELRGARAIYDTPADLLDRWKQATRG